MASEVSRVLEEMQVLHLLKAKRDSFIILNVMQSQNLLIRLTFIGMSLFGKFKRTTCVYYREQNDFFINLDI